MSKEGGIKASQVTKKKRGVYQALLPSPEKARRQIPLLHPYGGTSNKRKRSFWRLPP